MLAGNHVMIASGYGIISVPVEHQNEFRKMLIAFYESGDSDELSSFIYENCVDGMDFEYEADDGRSDVEKCEIPKEDWILTPAELVKAFTE
jgi:hypothetical protein